jgi:transposase
MTHDYKRNGTTTLFAALETLQGKVVGECHERHRHQEFLRFLRRLDTEFPGDVPLHLIMDNYGTHKHAKVKGVAETSSSVRIALRPDQFQLDVRLNLHLTLAWIAAHERRHLWQARQVRRHPAFPPIVSAQAG